ncbi:Uma2 family endonuclease [Streptomyces sp. MP131-18]|uniref:Uma2 family endonuclease n=1 Tax=Streptomyces sp. MP131-18 TaxID=1857892 RepID=UPI00097CBF5D|nr:Uma2 family endonuclease [Streptomyces sp. MP131-18]ONK14472.1 hypothetical protein STBA_52570 [Streptomyces sp. MP131-18]
MTVMTERPKRTDLSGAAEFEELCQALDRMDVPAGYQAEIVGGVIVVSPWSKGFCLDVMDSLAEQLKPHAPEGHRISQAPCLYVFPERLRGFGPDVHVAEAAATRIDSTRLPGEALSLVAERDRSEKVESYGRAGVPVYVLVDMLVSRVVVYSRPSAEDGYRTAVETKFGETAHVPAPFGCDIDTSDWES